MNKILAVVLVVSYFAVVVPFSQHLQHRPMIVKLGFVPNAGVVRFFAGEHRYLAAEMAILKVLFYYGTLVEKWQQRIYLAPEYQNMFRTIETAVKLDPYNIDAYYFAQAAFTWEVGHSRDVNRLLDYGMNYRTWDYYLPFFAGFNASYFLRDYPAAAGYMEKAAKISGKPLLANLAARYYYESGEQTVAILFLDEMIEKAPTSQERRIYQIRRQALMAVNTLTEAVKQFKFRYDRYPSPLEEMVSTGILATIPVDPYGGEFFLDSEGKIRSTSRFALRDQKNDKKSL